MSIFKVNVLKVPRFYLFVYLFMFVYLFLKSILSKSRDSTYQFKKNYFIKVLRFYLFCFLKIFLEKFNI